MDYHAFFLLFYLAWGIGLAFCFYFLCRLRETSFFVHRSPYIMFISQTYVFVSSVIVASSLVVDADFCMPLNIVYSLALPLCILPFYLLVPSVYIRGRLNRKMAQHIRNYSDWDWRLRVLYSTRVKLLVMLCATILQLTMYFILRFTVKVNGDCQLYSVYIIMVLMMLYLIPVLVIAIRLKNCDDPHFIRWEIVFTIVLIIPAVLGVILFIFNKWPIPFQYAYMYAAFCIFVGNLVLPLSMVYHKYRNRPTTTDLNVNIQEILDNNEYYISFADHCIKSCVTENWLFYQVVELYKQDPTYEKLLQIFAEYIGPKAPIEVNLDQRIVNKIKAEIDRIKEARSKKQPVVCDPDLLDEAIRTVTDMLRRDVIPKWTSKNGIILGSANSKAKVHKKLNKIDSSPNLIGRRSTDSEIPLSKWSSTESVTPLTKWSSVDSVSSESTTSSVTSNSHYYPVGLGMNAILGMSAIFEENPLGDKPIDPEEIV
jgi:hypothetical protein